MPFTYFRDVSSTTSKATEKGESLKRFICGFLLVIIITSLGYPQAATAKPSEHIESTQNTILITYSFEHAELNPTHFEFILDETGKGIYQADYAESSLQAGQPLNIQKPIQIGTTTMRKIIDKIEVLDYLKGNYDYTKQRISFSGRKTLTYKDSNHHGSTTLNWSENKDIMEIVDTFQGIQSTIELGRRLEYLYKHQKLGLFEEMKHAEEADKSGWLREVTLIKDILQKLYNDPNVILSVRNSAKRLMERTVRAQ
jgi:hypothetical protein